MSESKSVLLPETLAQIEKIKEADIIVGIPSFRNAKTIAHVVETVSKGLVRYFKGLRAVIINSDGGSEDKTREVFLAAKVDPSINKIATPYKGVAGKGSAFHTIFEIADRLHAKVLIVVDADLRSITPEWIRLLGEPVYKHNFGFVTPYYYRYKYDGTITNAIAYPLTRALYGQIVRQPIGGEFALSGSLAKIYAHEDVWSTDIARFGIDIWMTTTAICEGFRVCQAAMGVKLHDSKDPGTDLGPMFRQVVGTAFSLMKKYQMKWKAIRGSQPTDLFGDWPKQEPEPISVNLARLLDKFHQGLNEQKQIIDEIVSPGNREQLEAIRQEEEKVFRISDRLWARLVYDFSVAYNFQSKFSSQEVLTALMPLYFGRTASFVLQTEVMGATEAEMAVEKTADAFELEKRYLITRWEQAQMANFNSQPSVQEKKLRSSVGGGL